MHRTVLSLVLIGLSGCSATGAVRGDHAGFFDPPTAADLAAERARCYRSTFCREVFGEVPPALYAGLNDKRVAIEHAYEAERRLEGVDGVQRMQVVVGSRDGARGGRTHAVLLVTYDGRDYVIDQGQPAHRDGFRAEPCRSPAECTGQWESRREDAATCGNGICAARDGLHDFVVSGVPIPMWPKQDYIAVKTDPDR